MTDRRGTSKKKKIQTVQDERVNAKDTDKTRTIEAMRCGRTSCVYIRYSLKEKPVQRTTNKDTCKKVNT